MVLYNRLSDVCHIALYCIYQCEYVVFPQKRNVFIHTPRHNTNRARTSLECNRIPVLKWPANLPEMNSIEKFGM